MGDGDFTTKKRVQNLHLTKGTHWVASTRGKYFDSYGCSPPSFLTDFICKKNGICFFFRIQNPR